MEIDEGKQEEQKKEKAEQRKSALARMGEFYLWAFMGAIPIFFSILSVRDKIATPFQLFTDSYLASIWSIFCIFFPLLFFFIFYKMPLNYLRDWIKDRNDYELNEDEEEDDYVSKESNDYELAYLEECIDESKLISEKMQLRSGTYLLIGCMIAIFGVVLFYAPIFPVVNEKDISQRLISYLPRFSALFFVEFIAFFFLKQYRIMLEEFRYYEHIKRKRQDQYIFIKLVDHFKDNNDLLQIVNNKFADTAMSRMLAGETTEILETQKIVNQDMDILSKAAEILKIVKQK